MSELDGISLKQEKSGVLTAQDGTQYHKDVTDTFEVSDNAAKSVRNELPIGSTSTAIQRPEYSDLFLKKLQIDTNLQKKFANRCLTKVVVDTGNGTTKECFCFRTKTTVGTDAGLYCIEHNREAFRPQQTHAPDPRKRLVLNSAGIELTEAEKIERWKDKDGNVHEAVLKPGRDIGALRSGNQPGLEPPTTKDAEIKAPIRRKRADAGLPRQARKPKASPNEVVIRLTVDELTGDDPIQLFVDRATEALDNLPASSIREMKRVAGIQEQLQLWAWEPIPGNKILEGK